MTAPQTPRVRPYSPRSFTGAQQHAAQFGRAISYRDSHGTWLVRPDGGAQLLRAAPLRAASEAVTS